MSSDISSRAASILPTTSTPSTPLHFDAVIRTEYVEITEEAHSGRKRRKRSKIQYTYIICSSWGSHHRTNAIKHVNSRHPVPISSAQSSRTTLAPTRDISTIFTPISSPNGLRNSFNQQAYKEAIIGLLTRRRMPFSAVEWSEMKDLALACNPAIEDLLITSRRSAVRYIALNYRLYKEQIENSLSTALSPIHFS
ncbi:restless-like transposase, partial [Macrophomina phaseolina MS6]